MRTNSIYFKNTSDKNNYKARSYTGIYRIHKYWAKKPYNIIKYLIQKYSNLNDIILDPFCGSGISINEAILLRRKVIGIDINPVAIFITKQLIKKISIDKVIQEFKNIENDLKNKINSFYKIKRDNKEYIGTHFIWSENGLTEVWYKNPDTGKKVIDVPSEDDVILANSFEIEKINKFYPKNRLFYNTKINTVPGMRVYELYTPRNLAALVELMDRIEKIENPEIKDFFKFCFTSALGQCTRMVFVVKKRGKHKGNERTLVNKQVGSWIIGYWIPKEHFELNVWNCFQRKFNRIIKAKIKQYKLNYSLIETNSFNELLEHKNCMLITGSAQKILLSFPNNSIDYIITDPPHGKRQPYLELSLMWNSWLKFDVNYQDELVISDSKERNKDIKNYYQILEKIFKEIKRILKPNKFFTLIFNSLNKKDWKMLFDCLNKLNFKLIQSDSLNYSANSVVQITRKFGLKNDIILTFKNIKS